MDRLLVERGGRRRGLRIQLRLALRPVRLALDGEVERGVLEAVVVALEQRVDAAQPQRSLLRELRGDALAVDGDRAPLLAAVEGTRDQQLERQLYEIYFDKDRRREFFDYFQEVETLYEILSPDAALREHVATYQQLADLYATLRSEYGTHGGITSYDLGRKTELLLFREVITTSEYGAKRTVDLVDEPQPFQDYVIVHELLHLKVRNHGRVFRSLLTAHLPTWRRFCPTGLGTSCASRPGA